MELNIAFAALGGAVILALSSKRKGFDFSALLAGAGFGWLLYTIGGF